MSSASTRFAIAVHILAVLGYLETKGIRLASSDQIARSVNANAVVIRTILRALKKAGLVHSKEGKGGGVSLARRPAQISLREIHAAVDGRGALAARTKPAYKPCPVSCGMKDAFAEVATEVDDAIGKVLGRKTLKELVEKFR
jgi:Rrf2 family protein